MAVHIKNMCHAAYFKCMFHIRKNRRNLKNLRFFFQSSFLLFQIDFHAFNGVLWKIVLLPKRYLTPAIGMLSTSRMQMGKNVMMHPIVQIVFIFYLFFLTYIQHMQSMYFQCLRFLQVYQHRTKSKNHFQYLCHTDQ